MSEQPIPCGMIPGRHYDLNNEIETIGWPLNAADQSPKSVLVRTGKFIGLHDRHEDLLVFEGVPIDQPGDWRLLIERRHCDNITVADPPRARAAA